MEELDWTGIEEPRARYALRRFRYTATCLQSSDDWADFGFKHFTNEYYMLQAEILTTPKLRKGVEQTEELRPIIKQRLLSLEREFVERRWHLPKWQRPKWIVGEQDI